MIEKVEIHEFRKFKNCTIQLGDNVTAIAGHNATGKSTILALLGHCAELKPKVAKPLGGGSFRTEFSQIIHVDPLKDIRSNKLMTFYTKSLDKTKEEVFYYRSTVQEGNRYRIFPVRGKLSSKIEWPVIYLGLSRVYPFGESTKLSLRNDERIKDLNFEDMIDKYLYILNQTDKITGIEAVNTDITGKSKLSSFGIDTESYNYFSNSAGQSTLGQIMLAIESFKLLQLQLKEKWNGGLLLIDELDATLHPSAQAKLLDYLINVSKDIGLQICFTTHSLYLLENISRYISKHKDGSVAINYLFPEDDHIEVGYNPDYDTMKYDLMMLLPPEKEPERIKVYVEDDEAKYFAESLLGKYLNRIEVISTQLGSDNLLKLFKVDDHFRNSIICLDGDAVDKIDGFKPEERNYAKKSIIFLPDKKNSPERVLYNFLFNENTDIGSILNPGVGLNRRNINERFRQNEEAVFNKRENAKNWFNLLLDQQPTFMSGLMDLYMDKKKSEYNDFKKSFIKAFNYIADKKRLTRVR